MKRLFLGVLFIGSLAFSGEKELIDYIKSHNPKLSDKEAQYIYKNVVHYSNEFDFDPVLVFSVMKTESNFRHSTVSSAGAKGLMQLMPFNFEEFGVDNSIQGNIKGGTIHLKRDYDKTKDITKTLVCYNAGCAKLKNNQWLKIKETTNYIAKIDNIYREIKDLYYDNARDNKEKKVEYRFEPREEVVVVKEEKQEKFFKNKIRFLRKEIGIWNSAVYFLCACFVLLFIHMRKYRSKNKEKRNLEKQKQQKLKLRNYKMKQIEDSIKKQRKQIKKNILGNKY